MILAAVNFQTLSDAVGLGAIYALMAVGIGLVFGVLRLVNFAYGQLVMAGAGKKPSKAILITDYTDGNDMVIGKPGIASMKALKANVHVAKAMPTSIVESQARTVPHQVANTPNGASTRK